MDLWLKLEQARNDNKDKIEKLQKMIEDKIPCDTLPEFLRPQAMLDCFNYVKLEKIMHEYQAHFKQEINEMEIELELNGWEILLEYCIASNIPLEKISNIDIYRIIARANSCLEEDEICDVPISYQKNIIYRKIVNLIKRMKR